MILINYEKKAIFIHLPKCAGSHTRYLLTNFYNFHVFNNTVMLQDLPIIQYYMKLDKLLDMNAEKWKSFYKFTFIRDPYQRLISSLKYLKTQYKHDYKSLEELFNDKENLKQNHMESYIHCFVPQYEHLLNLHNKFNINFIGHVETFEEDFNKLLKCLFMKNLHSDIIHNIKYAKFFIYNSSNEKFDYTRYDDNNNTLLQTINTQFEKDFSLSTKYQMFNNVDDLKQHYSNVDIKTPNTFKKLIEENNLTPEILQLEEHNDAFLKTTNTNNEYLLYLCMLMKLHIQYLIDSSLTIIISSHVYKSLEEIRTSMRHFMYQTYLPYLKNIELFQQIDFIINNEIRILNTLLHKFEIGLNYYSRYNKIIEQENSLYEALDEFVDTLQKYTCKIEVKEVAEVVAEALPTSEALPTGEALPTDPVTLTEKKDEQS